MRSRHFSVSPVIMTYAAVVFVTASATFLPRQTNMGAYLLLIVLTAPTSAVAILFIFFVGGLLFPFSDNLAVAIFAIVTWMMLLVPQLILMNQLLRQRQARCAGRSFER